MLDASPLPAAATTLLSLSDSGTNGNGNGSCSGKQACRTKPCAREEEWCIACGPRLAAGGTGPGGGGRLSGFGCSINGQPQTGIACRSNPRSKQPGKPGWLLAANRLVVLFLSSAQHDFKSNNRATQPASPPASRLSEPSRPPSAPQNILLYLAETPGLLPWRPSRASNNHRLLSRLLQPSSAEPHRPFPYRQAALRSASVWLRELRKSSA